MTSIRKCVLLLLLAIAGGGNWPVEAAKIIFLNMFQSKSHALTLLPLAERLAERGHSVALYSQSVSSIGNLGNRVQNMETIIPATDDFAGENVISKLFWEADTLPEIYEAPYRFNYGFLRDGLNDTTFQQMLATPYDIAVVDEGYASAQSAMGLKLRQLHATKLVLFSTTEIFPSASCRRAYARNPATFPDFYVTGTDIFEAEQTFSKRVRSALNVAIDELTAAVLADKYLRWAGELLGVENSGDIFFKSALLTLTDFPSSYSFPAPRSHDLVYAGEHCQQSKSLSSEFAEFVDDPTSKGTIYVAFGSITQLDDGPPGTVDEFVKALNHFTSYRVIWSYKGDVASPVAKHVRITAWAPQNDILAHPKTIVFFTHGGLKSLKEGLCSATPMLFLPFFGDQNRNALGAIQHGIAEVVYKKNISAEEIVTKMSRLLTEERFLSTVKKLSAIYRNQPMDALDLGSFFVERTLRFSDDDIYKFSRRRGMFMGNISYFLLDVVVVLMLLVGLLSR